MRNREGGRKKDGLVSRHSLSVHDFCLNYAEIVCGGRGPGNEARIKRGADPISLRVLGTSSTIVIPLTSR